MSTAWQYLNGSWKEWYRDNLSLEGYYRDRGEFLTDVRRMMNALACHDAATATHSAHVWRYTMALADEFGLDGPQREQLGLAAKLHDIGKIGIPQSLLHKVDDLTPEEYGWLQNHVVLGERLTRTITPCPAVHEAVRWHHERPDGRGYPDRLRGDRIPLFARILGVAEAFAAMTDDRPSGPPQSWEAALATLRREAGRQFDGEVVERFARVLRRLHVRADVLLQRALAEHRR